MLSQNQRILMKRARGDGESGDGVAMDNPNSVREFLSDMSGKKRTEYESLREEAAEKKTDSGQQKGNERSNHSFGERKRPNPRDDESDFDERPPPKKASTAKGTTKKARSRRADDDSDSGMDYEAPAKSAASSSRPSRATTTKKPKYTYDDSGAEEIEDSEDEVRPKSTSRGKKVALSSPRNGRNSRPTINLESDSDDEPSSHFRGGGAWGNAIQSTNGRSRR